MSEETLQESSRRVYYLKGESPTYLELQTGAIQRIASACELMAKEHSQLVYDRDRYDRLYRNELRVSKRKSREISGLRGYITRLKNKLEASK